MTSGVWRMLRNLALVLLAVSGSFLLVISWLVSQVQAAGGQDYGMLALTGPHWPPWSTSPVADALAAWFAARETVDQLRGWLLAFVLVDALVFTPAYGAVLVTVLRYTRRRWAAVGSVTTSYRLPAWLAVVPVAFDEVENLLTWLLIDRATAASGTAALQDGSAFGSWWPAVLVVSTGLKWLSLWVLVLAALGVLIVARRRSSAPVAR